LKINTALLEESLRQEFPDGLWRQATLDDPMEEVSDEIITFIKKIIETQEDYLKIYENSRI